MREGGVRPSYDRYVSGLPGGLGAFPGAHAKGSIVRSMLDAQPPDLLRALPEPIRHLALDPPIDSDWVSEAHFGALVHAVAEGRAFREPEYRAWVRSCNRALFASPLYRILIAVESPEALLRHAGKRWGNFHRGSTLDFDGFADDGVRLSLRFPAGLFDRLLLIAFGEAFAAALEVARAPDPVIEIEAAGAGFARYRAHW